ncbi:50S ribosomal protein L18 [archaeon]|nr:50S ribosomal protein L18 [archaeon]|tara:strand:+ start:2341 stop:2823 length:483 start_codon:yes stop_codon:yes gene_type:complete
MENLKRRVNQKTDYKKRIALLKSGKIRLVVRKSLNSFLIQFVDYVQKGDKTVSETNSFALKKLGWKGHTGNIPSAYLAGLMAGTKAKEAGVEKSILDIGLQRSTKGNSIYAVVKGVADAGIKITFDKKMIPSDDRIKGDHIQNKENIGNFEEIKKKILSE